MTWGHMVRETEMVAVGQSSFQCRFIRHSLSGDLNQSGKPGISIKRSLRGADRSLVS